MKQPPSSLQTQVSALSPLTSSSTQVSGLIPHPSDDDVLVRVENVSKKFCRDLKKSLWYGMKDLGSELIGRHRDSDELRPDEFWAVKDVSFELRRGECLGLIGRNGAGKTTLLRMLNGLIKPDKGRIEMRGRVGALIALGAGFNPILTGRENIYVNASVLGFSTNEITSKLDEIIAFSELDEVLDSPVQTYSSGMTVRLGFAIAVHFNLDILLLDEVLAVGDAKFRAKCYSAIGKRMSKSATILVTHNMEHLARVCSSAVLLDHGILRKFSSVTNAAYAYEHVSRHENNREHPFQHCVQPLTEAKVNPHEQFITIGATAQLTLQVQCTFPINGAWVRVVIYNTQGFFIADAQANLPTSSLEVGKSTLYIHLKDLRLRNGRYPLTINLFDSKGNQLLWSFKECSIIIVDAHHLGNADYQPDMDILYV